MQDKSIKNNLKSIREQENLTQKQLATLSGIHKRVILRIENNDHIPSLQTAYSICDVLNVSIYDIFPKECILDKKRSSAKVVISSKIQTPEKKEGSCK